MSTAPRLRSLPDRLRQIALFEAGGLLLITPPFVWLSGQPALPSLGLLAILALIAAVWNGLFNTAFDWAEGRLTGRPADRRPVPVRALQAVLFEGGLLLLTLPVIVLWTGLGWWPALIADLGLAVHLERSIGLISLGLIVVARGVVARRRSRRSRRAN